MQENMDMKLGRKTPYSAFLNLTHWRGTSQLFIFQPFAVKLFGKPKQVLPPVDTKLII